MKTRHSIQIKQLLEKKHLSKSRFNPESRVVIKVSPSTKQSREVKRSQSSSSVHATQNTQKQRKVVQLELMERRYKELYQSYLKLLEQSNKRAEMRKRQDEEISKYEKACERDKKQIQRLRMMVGLARKCDFGIQTISEKHINVDSGSHLINNNEEISLQDKQIRIKQHEKNKQNPTNTSKKQTYDGNQYKNSQKSNLTSSIILSKTSIQNSKHSSLSKPKAQEHDSFRMKQHFYTSASVKALKQGLSQKRIPVKKIKYQSSHIVNDESIISKNKSSANCQLKKRKMQHVGNYSELLNGQANNKTNQKRVSSPNSRFKFVPNVQI